MTEIQAAWRVETLSVEEAAKQLAAWSDLAGRALEANVFAEPAFLLNALRHFAMAANLKLLFVWDGDRRLIGAAVLQFVRFAPGLAAARVWQSSQAGLPALMLDHEAAGPALEAILNWLVEDASAAIGLFVPTLEAAGPTAAAMRALSQRRGLRLHEVGRRARAILPAAGKLARGFEASLPKKRIKEWSRQIRRLRERGALGSRVASDGESIERFLALEAKGWKGAQHTALGGDARLAAFTRSMLGTLAEEGRLAVHMLELDGETLAVGLVLRSRDRAFYWKTAYDEAYAEFSPGVQLTLELSRAQQRDAAISLTDSCAISGHPMIDRLWTARLDLVDCVVAVRSGRAYRLALWLAVDAARLRLREAAKRVINPLRGRKRS